jgi:tetratricopeptide (TPR) repeat protein
LGEADLANGRFDRAGAAYEAALPAFEKAYGKEHAKVGECLFDLAKAKAGLGHNDEAYRLYRRARAIAEKSFDANDPRLAGTLAGWLDAYAGLLRDLGKTDEAAATTASAATIRARIAPASSLATDKKD